MATEYSVNYDDKRFAEVEADKKAALNETDVTYGSMINNADKYYNDQIKAAQDYADKQTALQNQQTEFAIDKIEQQKEQTHKDYIKEQSAAYGDWQKQTDPYGVNAEKIADMGLQNSGYADSLQVSMYNTYQNRVATAREAYSRAVLDFDNQITEARMQNNAVLAEIAYNALQTRLGLSLQGFQYKNTLILEKTKEKRAINDTYYGRYQDVLQQINTENALAEEVRQYNEKMAEEKRQYDESLKISQAQLKLQQDQFAWQKSQAAKSSSGGSSSIKKSSGGSSGSSAKQEKKVVKTNSGRTKTVMVTSGSEYLEALIASGASKDKVANEIAIALREGEITSEEARLLRNRFTPSGVQY